MQNVPKFSITLQREKRVSNIRCNFYSSALRLCGFAVCAACSVTRFALFGWVAQRKSSSFKSSSCRFFWGSVNRGAGFQPFLRRKIFGFRFSDQRIFGMFKTFRKNNFIWICPIHFSGIQFPGKTAKIRFTFSLPLLLVILFLKWGWREMKMKNAFR